jgi:sphingomyelin phosphodiesterase 2
VREGKLQLRPRSSRVSWTEVDESLGCSLSDHFGVETTFELVPSAAVTAHSTHVAQTLTSALAALGGALLDSRRTQTTHGVGFLGALAGALFALMILTAGHAPGILRFLLALFVIVAAWAGTTLFYSAVIWGEWEKRECPRTSHAVLRLMTLPTGALRTVLDAMALDLEQTRGRIAAPRPAVLAELTDAQPAEQQPHEDEEGRPSVEDTHEQQRLI